MSASTLFIHNVLPHKFAPSQSQKKKNSKESFKKCSVPPWCSNVPEEFRDETTKTKELTPAQIEDLYVKALDAFILSTKHKNDKKSFDEEIIQKGTTVDRVAALSLMIVKDPIANLVYTDKLLDLCESNNSRAAEIATKATVDLFLNNLMTYRKLKYFKDQNLSPIRDLLEKENSDKSKVKFKKTRESLSTAEICLLYFYFEEQLKKKFKRFVEIVVARSKSTIEATKFESIISMKILICSTMEQREELIDELANKIGDPIGKIASIALSSLQQLINPFQSENYKNPYYCSDIDRKKVIKFVANYIYSTKSDIRCKTRAASFLHTIELRSHESELAKILIEIALRAIKINFSTNIDTKLMGGLLACIRKTYNISGLPASYISGYTETFFNIARNSNLNISLEAIRVLLKLVLTSNNTELTNRYFKLLYSILLNRGIQKHFEKVPVLLNTVLYAIEGDSEHARQAALLKRLLQISLFTPANYTCSIICMTDYLMKKDPWIKMLKTQVEKPITASSVNDEDDDEDEKFVDVDKIKEESDQNKSNRTKKDQKNNNNTFHTSSPYDPFNTFPESSKADRSCLWEMLMLVKHYHPNASYFAKQVLYAKENNDNLYGGNPIDDFSLTEFLDKFMYKKPRQKLTFDPISSHYSQSKSDASLPLILNEEFKKLPEDLVRADERFLHKYMKRRDEFIEQRKRDENKLKEEREKDKEKKLDLVGRLKSDLIIDEAQRKKKDQNIDKEDEIDSDDDITSEVSSLYSYSELDDVLAREHEIDDGLADELLMQYASDNSDDDDDDEDDDDDDDEEGSRSKKNKKKNKKKKKGEGFAYDVTSGAIEDVSKPKQDEIASLLEEDEHQFISAMGQSEPENDDQDDDNSNASSGNRQRNTKFRNQSSTKDQRKGKEQGRKPKNARGKGRKGSSSDKEKKFKAKQGKWNPSKRQRTK